MQNDFTIELGKPGSIRYHAREGRPSWTVTLVDTGQATQTGARIKRAAQHLDGGTFAVTYGDGVADVDLDAVLAYHRSHGKKATVTGVRPPSRFGEIEHRDGRVLSFNEKPQASAGIINGGFFFFEPSFVDYLDAEESCALERAPLERCVAEDQLRVFEHTGFWHCMDTYRDWEQLEGYCKVGQPPWERGS
jgi:glucose-1-phosphate cytidylyltransferase